MNRNSHIRWKQHPATLTSIWKEYRDNDGLFTDCTLVCGSYRYPVHSAVLSANSEFFQFILQNHPPHIEPHIVVEGVDEVIMEAVIKYLYTGVIGIDAVKTRQFLQLCTSLQIKGLMTYEILNKDEEDETNNATEVTIEYEDQPENPDPDLLVFLNQRTTDYVEQEEALEMPEEEQSTEILPDKEQMVEEFVMVEEPEPKFETPPVLSKRPTRFSRPSPEKKRRKCSEGYTEEHVTSCIEAVCSGELNLSTASHMYNIPKSVLWRKLKRRPDYVPTSLDKRREAARKAILDGESMDAIHQKYNISLATLYRDKAQLIKDGYLDGQVKDKTEVKNALQMAQAACAAGMAPSEAARKFKVSKSTLWRKMKKADSA